MFQIIATVRDEEGAKLLAAALMPNHPHLSWRVSQSPLSRIMHRILTSYSTYFNKRYDHSGYVFQGRYKSYLCVDQSYLVTHIRYIHQNPQRAGLEKSLGEWPWTTHADYLGTSKRPLADAEVGLSFFGPDLKSARRRYRNLVEQPVTEDPLQSYAMVELEEDTTPLIRQEISDPVSLVKIAAAVAAKRGIAANLIGSGSRRREIVAAKRIFVGEAILSGHSTRRIAEFLDCTLANVSLLLHSRVQ